MDSWICGSNFYLRICLWGDRSNVIIIFEIFILLKMIGFMNR